MNSAFEIDRLAPHLLDLAHRDEAPVERGVEQAQPVAPPAGLVARRGAREDQHPLRDLRRRDPDLGAIDDIAVAAPHRPRLDPRGVEPGIGLGHREAGFLGSGDERRQHAALLLLAAEADDRVQPEDVHVHGRRARHPGARFGDRLHHDRGLGDAEARAAIGFRHADAEPAAGGQGAMQLVRKAAIAVALEPIVRAEAGADAGDGIAHRLLGRGEREIHLRRLPSGMKRHAASSSLALYGRAR